MKNIKIQPLFGNVLVKPLEAEAKTVSGIILPDTAKKESQAGEVMAIGPGDVTPKGDQKVMYKKWGGNEVKVGNEEWTIIEQKDILAIIN